MFKIIWFVLKFIGTLANDPVIRTALADVAAARVSDFVMGDSEIVRPAGYRPRPNLPYSSYPGYGQRKPVDKPRSINNARLHSLSLDAEPNAFGGEFSTGVDNGEIYLSEASRHLMAEYDERTQKPARRIFEVDTEGTATERDLDD